MIVATSLKDYILINYDQATMFSKYLRVSLSEIDNCIDYKSSMSNPLRTDNNPSLRFYFTKWGKLKMHDTAIRMFRFDIFDLVGYLYDKNTNNASDFVDICNIIIESPGIPKKRTNIVKKSDSDYRVILPTTREWWKSDKTYWSKIGVTREHLINRNVYPILYVHIDGKVAYYETAYGPKYCYFLDYYKNIALYKIYAPQFKIRFRTNNKFKIEALHELYKADELIITKARKDKLAIECLLDNGSIDYALRENALLHGSKYCVTNLSGEAIRLPEAIVKWMKEEYKHVILNLDYDDTGIYSGFYFKTMYDIDITYLGRSIDVLKDIKLDSLTKETKTYINNLNAKAKSSVTVDSFYQFIEKHSGNYKDKDITDYVGSKGITNGVSLVNNLFSC